jgi:hypothetical protein
MNGKSAAEAFANPCIFRKAQGEVAAGANQGGALLGLGAAFSCLADQSRA